MDVGVLLEPIDDYGTSEISGSRLSVVSSTYVWEDTVALFCFLSLLLYLYAAVSK